LIQSPNRRYTHQCADIYKLFLIDSFFWLREITGEIKNSIN